jgi:hypothetical protein
MDFTLGCAYSGYESWFELNGGFELGLLSLVGALFAGAVATWLVWHRVHAVCRLIATDLWPLLRARWIAHRVRAVPQAGPRLLPGTRVRLCGVVESELPDQAALSGVATVVCWHALGEVCGGTVAEGVTASSFVLRLADGNAVRVAADQAAAAGRLTLADRARHHWTDRRRMRAWYCESRVSPGDRIEVAGVLRRDLDPAAPRLHERQPPLGWSLEADDHPLVLAFATMAPPSALAAAS